MAKTKTIRNVTDQSKFKISKKKNAATWTLQTIRKGRATITSVGGSTRMVLANTKIYC